MRRFRIGKRICAALLGLALAAMTMDGAPVSIKATDESDVNQAEDAVRKAQQEVDELNAKLDDIRNNISDTKTYIAELDATYSEYASKLAEASGNVDAKQAEIDALQLKIDALQQEITAKKLEIVQTKEALETAEKEQNEQYEAMKLRIQYMYEAGEESFLDMIFSAEDFADMLGRTEYISVITAYDRAQLQAMIDNKNSISDMLVKLETEEATLEEQEASLESELATLEDEQRVLASLQTEYSNQKSYVEMILDEKKGALSNMEGNADSTETMLAMAEQELAEQKAFAEQIRKRYEEEKRAAEAAGKDAGEVAQETLDSIFANGGFTWPLPGFTTITSPYGYRTHPIYGDWRLHDGTDIAGSGCDGKPIIAAYSGTVILAEYYYGYGNTVQISHGSGVVTQYSHCSSLAVSVGDYVTTGQTIAYVGMTGGATGPHLHFGLYIEGGSVDPMNYVFP